MQTTITPQLGLATLWPHLLPPLSPPLPFVRAQTRSQSDSSLTLRPHIYSDPRWDLQPHHPSPADLEPLGCHRWGERVLLVSAEPGRSRPLWGATTTASSGTQVTKTCKRVLLGSAEPGRSRPLWGSAAERRCTNRDGEICWPPTGAPSTSGFS